MSFLEQTRSSKIPRDVSSSAILAKIEKMADRFKTSGFIIEEEIKFCRITGDLHAPHPYVWYPETALMGIERRNNFIETHRYSFCSFYSTMKYINVSPWNISINLKAFFVTFVLETTHPIGG